MKFKGGESELEIYEALRNASEEAEINLIPYDPAVTVGNAQIAQHPETAGYVAKLREDISMEQHLHL